MAKGKEEGGYKALTFIELGDTKFSPGSKITKSALEDAGQGEGGIEALLSSGAISEDMDAPVLEAHTAPEPEEGVITASDEGSGN